MSDSRDGWLGGNSYEAFMGRWSRLLAEDFVHWLAPAPGLHWLDVGCGTGALAGAILRQAEPADVVGCDPAEPLIAFAQHEQRDPRASFVLAGAGSLPERSGGYDVIVSQLALNFMPDPVAALCEMRDRLRPGGCVAVNVWDYAGRMQFLREFWDAAVALDAAAREADEGVRFPLCRPDALREAFQAAALENVVCEPLEISTRFECFEDYWKPMLAGTGPASAYVAGLTDGARAALSERLRRRLIPSGDGAIELVARAWGVRGSRPGAAIDA